MTLLTKERAIDMPRAWDDGTPRSPGNAFSAAYLRRAPISQAEPTKKRGPKLTGPAVLDSAGRMISIAPKKNALTIGPPADPGFIPRLRKSSKK
jgi:hypothetical protein